MRNKKENGTFKGLSFSTYQKINKILKKEYIPENFDNVIPTEPVAREYTSHNVDSVGDIEDGIEALKSVKYGHVLLRRWGLGGYKKSTLVQISRKLKVTRERIRQMEAYAIYHAKMKIELFNKPVTVLKYIDKETEETRQTIAFI